MSQVYKLSVTPQLSIGGVQLYTCAATVQTVQPGELPMTHLNTSSTAFVHYEVLLLQLMLTINNRWIFLSFGSSSNSCLIWRMMQIWCWIYSEFWESSWFLQQNRWVMNHQVCIDTIGCMQVRNTNEFMDHIHSWTNADHIILLIMKWLFVVFYLMFHVYQDHLSCYWYCSNITQLDTVISIIRIIHLLAKHCDWA